MRPAGVGKPQFGRLSNDLISEMAISEYSRRDIRQNTENAHGRHSSVSPCRLLTDHGSNMLGVEHAPFVTL